jgi:hypothetical protein
MLRWKFIALKSGTCSNWASIETNVLCDSAQTPIATESQLIELLEVVHALGPASGLSGRLYRREQ